MDTVVAVLIDRRLLRRGRGHLHTGLAQLRPDGVALVDVLLSAVLLDRDGLAGLRRKGRIQRLHARRCREDEVQRIPDLALDEAGTAIDQGRG